MALGAGAAVILLGLLLVAIRKARRLLGFLVVVGGIVAIAAAYFVATSPRDRYIDFAVQKGAPAGQSDEVRASLANLFEVSGRRLIWASPDQDWNPKLLFLNLSFTGGL